MKGTIVPSYSFTLDDHLRKLVLNVIVDTDGNKKNYDPFFFLNIVLMSYYRRIDKVKELDKRVSMIFDCKVMITNYIEVFKDEIDRVNTVNFPVKDYDFSRTMKQVDAVIDKMKLELDVNKYNLEVRKLRQETILFLRALPYMISSLALLISWLSYDKAHSTTQKVQIELIKEK